MGVGLPDPGSGIFQNPGYLKKHQIQSIQLGLHGSFYGGEVTPVIPGGIGGFYNWEDSRWAIYGNFSTLYANYLPVRDYVHLNRGMVGLSYQWDENWVLSVGLGGAASSRFRSISQWTETLQANLYYEGSDWTFGLQMDHSGSMERSDYLGGDELEEKPPDRISAGVGYHWTEDLVFYSEVRKLFWEPAYIRLNGLEETPDWERGFGAEWAVSGSILWNRLWDSSWNLRSGLDWGGVYDPTGKNRRHLGIAFGLGKTWSLDGGSQGRGKLLSLDLGILDYTITSTKKNRSPETIYSFSISYRYTE